MKNIKPFPRASFDNIIPLSIDDRIGIVSDTHIGSKYSRLNSLGEIYDTFDNAGVKQVFHAGDMTDGTEVYQGQYNDLSKIGYDNQAQEVIRKYPRKKDMTTKFIMGNHDGIYMKKQGSDICKYIGDVRKDLDYTGIYYTRFKDKNDNISMDLVHPDGGMPYSISYGTQKYLRNSPPSHHPNILVQGHRHQAFYGYYQEVHALEAGCFQDPSDFMIRKGASGNVGGWLVDMERKDGKIKKFRPEWISFNGNK